MASSLSGDPTTDIATVQSLQKAFTGGRRQNGQNLLDVSDIHDSPKTYPTESLTADTRTGNAKLHALRPHRATNSHGRPWCGSETGRSYRRYSCQYSSQHSLMQ